MLLIERIEDFLMENNGAFTVFARSTLLLRYDGIKKTSNGPEMALGMLYILYSLNRRLKSLRLFFLSTVSFPTVTRRSNGCICPASSGSCICSLALASEIPCECYGTLLIENVNNFKEVVQGVAGKDLSKFFEKLKK